MTSRTTYAAFRKPRDYTTRYSGRWLRDVEFGVRTECTRGFCKNLCAAALFTYYATPHVVKKLRIARLPRLPAALSASHWRRTSAFSSRSFLLWSNRNVLAREKNLRRTSCVDSLSTIELRHSKDGQLALADACISGYAGVNIPRTSIHLVKY